MDKKQDKSLLLMLWLTGIALIVIAHITCSLKRERRQDDERIELEHRVDVNKKNLELHYKHNHGID